MRERDDTWAGAIGRDIGRYLLMLWLIFIVLKACDLIDWRWVAVLIPLWCEIVNAIVCGIIAQIEKRRRKSPLEELADSVQKVLHETLGKGGKT